MVSSMWTLVLIWIFEGEPHIRKVETYSDMYACFHGYDKWYNTILPEDKTGVRLTCVEGETKYE